MATDCRAATVAALEVATAAEVAVTVAAMAVAITATAAVVTAAKARPDPSAAALLRRWRCWRARCCNPRHRRCRHCLARRRRGRHRRGAPRAALPGGGRPDRPGDAKQLLRQLLGSSQDEHAAAVRCYGKQLSALARPPRGRAPPASPPPPSTHCLRPCCTR